MEDFIHMKAYNLPYDLLIETIGNLYVADWSNTMRFRGFHYCFTTNSMHAVNDILPYKLEVRS